MPVWHGGVVSTAIHVRTASPGDLPDVQAVFRRSSLSNEGDRALFVPHPELLHLDGGSIAERRTRVAVAGAQLVGFASTSVRVGAVEIEELFVDRGWMRRGIGRALVTDVLASSRRAARSAVEVDANSAAVEFYAKLGFVPTAEVALEHGPAIRMRLVIDDAVPRVGSGLRRGRGRRS